MSVPYLFCCGISLSEDEIQCDLGFSHHSGPWMLVFFSLRIYACIYLFMYGCTGSLLLRVGFLCLQCTGFSLSWLLCGARALGCIVSVVVAHGFSCTVTCGFFSDQGLNPLAGGFLSSEPPGKTCLCLL